MSKKKTGLILGLLTGATLGVLFSPDKGKKIREKVSKQMNKKGLCSLLSTIKEKLHLTSCDTKEDCCSDCCSSDTKK